MPRRPTITAVRTEWAGSRQWKVDIAATIADKGRRQRHFFATKVEAETFCQQQRTTEKNLHTAALSGLDVVEAAQAAAAFEALRPYKVTLMEVVTEWISRRTATEASIPFEKAMDEFLVIGDRSPSYIRSIRQTRNRLKDLHGKRLNTITAADLTKVLDPLKPSVRNFSIRILGGLFNFAIKRDFCAENPCKRLDLTRREPNEIEIYTSGEVSAIMLAAEKNDQELIPFLAVSFFCGLRRSEALRIHWAAVDLQERFVRLPAAITKTRQVRHIELTDNGWEWLQTYSKSDGKLLSLSPEVLRKRLAALKKCHKVRTIKHGARHCFASYWLAKHGDINLLCRFLGHDDPETTFKHYAKAATKREAEKFWEIKPKQKKMGKILPFEATA
jgi:integrase